MVTPKEEREVIFPVWLTSYFTVFAVLMAIAIGAILYFKSPQSVRTSPNLEHNVVAPADRTNAPHFTPSRDYVGQPQAPAGSVDGRMMAPGRTLPQPGALGDRTNTAPSESPGTNLRTPRPGDVPTEGTAPNEPMAPANSGR